MLFSEWWSRHTPGEGHAFPDTGWDSFLTHILTHLVFIALGGVTMMRT